MVTEVSNFPFAVLFFQDAGFQGFAEQLSGVLFIGELIEGVPGHVTGDPDALIAAFFRGALPERLVLFKLFSLCFLQRFEPVVETDLFREAFPVTAHPEIRRFEVGAFPTFKVLTVIGFRFFGNHRFDGRFFFFNVEWRRLLLAGREQKAR